MKKQIYISLAALFIIIIGLWYFLGGEESSSETISTEVKFGEFTIAVTTTGELEAKNSKEIYGPDGLRNVRIWNVKIEDIVADGTVVDSGDFVASLDRSELANRMKDQELEVEKYETQLTKTRLDTTLELRNLRDDLINLEYSLEEKNIQLEQSKFEPPATIRQVEIELEKATRGFNQAVKNYQLKLQKNNANMQEVSGQLAKARRKYDQMAEVLEKFTVFAPQSGMVIYKRDWDGQKKGVGSQISPWDNVVATLPDLTNMMSKTYVNEIDISKVKTGQMVKIGIDAFPEKEFTGEVTTVANIGEQLPNTNVKVFEVMIEVYEFDSVMRPAMTTKNIILTDIIDSVLFIPIECVHTQDSISYIVSGNRKRQVVVGKSNENEIIVRAGLKEGDEIFLVPPEGYKDFDIRRLEADVLKVFKEEKRLKLEAKKRSDSLRMVKKQEKQENGNGNGNGPKGFKGGKKKGRN
ncbi:MAG: RND transporter [Bacteroidetes bacterium]|nr:MAG: RND transporter [Bacteroidota bacterium]